MREDLAETLEQDGNVYSTYGWHPLSVDVAITNLRWMKRSQDRRRQVERTGAYFAERIRKMALRRSRSFASGAWRSPWTFVTRSTPSA